MRFEGFPPDRRGSGGNKKKPTSLLAISAPGMVLLSFRRRLIRKTACGRAIVCKEGINQLIDVNAAKPMASEFREWINGEVFPAFSKRESIADLQVAEPEIVVPEVVDPEPEIVEEHIGRELEEGSSAKDLIPFVFEDTKVRWQIRSDGRPGAVAADVCRVLGYPDSSIKTALHTLVKHVPDEFRYKNTISVSSRNRHGARMALRHD